MVATAGLLLLHVPPSTASVSVVLAPTQMEVAPPIGDTGFTVIDVVTVQPAGAV